MPVAFFTPVASHPANSKASQMRHVVFGLDPNEPESEANTIARYKLIVHDWIGF